VAWGGLVYGRENCTRTDESDDPGEGGGVGWRLLGWVARWVGGGKEERGRDLDIIAGDDCAMFGRLVVG